MYMQVQSNASVEPNLNNKHPEVVTFLKGQNIYVLHIFACKLCQKSTADLLVWHG